MSGRKQHYIPQFLLRSFSEGGKGKKLQVRVITRDGSFIASTEGIAAQREFYSKLGEKGALDDLITEAETEYALIFQRLMELPSHCTVPSQDVARLLAHLAIRGGHIRDTLAVFGRSATYRVAELMSDATYMRATFGVDRPEPNDEMRKRLDGIFNERRAELIKVPMSRHEFRKWAFSQFKANWDEIFAQMVPHIRLMTSLVDMSALTTSGHQKALADSFEPQVRVEGLAKLDWYIRETSTPTFILPDCVALAHYDRVGAAPLVYLGKDDLNAALFPVSPTRAICAGAYASLPLLGTLTSNFPLFASMASWNFIVTPPSLLIEPTVGTRIGDAVVQMLSQSLEEAVGEMIAEAVVN